MTAWLRTRRRSADDAERHTAARIAALPRDDPSAALAQVNVWLGELASVRPAGLAGSLSALELLDQAARSQYRAATRRFLHGPEGLRENTLAATVEECLARLAQRYQSHVVLWRANAAKPALPKALLVRSLAGGVRACAAVLKWSYLRQTASPVGVWADMCTLYAVAEAAGCTRTLLEWQYSSSESCVEREFLKGCMLAAGGPETMSPNQVDITERLAGYCAADLGLSQGADLRYAWFIDLEAGEPPCQVDRTALLPARARSFGIASDERFYRLLHLVEADRLPPEAFGAKLDKGGVMQTLRQLARHWLRPDPAREPLAA
jgi:hypothetical protein